MRSEYDTSWTLGGCFAHILVETSSSRTLPNPYVSDKACLRQDNIDKSLASLPIFLSGCEHLLILAGDTYVSRLWCTAFLGGVC